MSAVPVAPQALQAPDAESIEPPSVNRKPKAGKSYTRLARTVHLTAGQARQTDLAHLVYSICPVYLV